MPSSLETARTAASVSYTLTVSLKPDAPAGLMRDEIRMISNDPEAPSIPVMVTAWIRGELTAAPSVLSLGQIHSAAGVQGRFVVRASRPFAIRAIEGAGDGFSTSPPDGKRAADARGDGRLQARGGDDPRRHPPRLPRAHRPAGRAAAGPDGDVARRSVTRNAGEGAPARDVARRSSAAGSRANVVDGDAGWGRSPCLGTRGHVADTMHLRGIPRIAPELDHAAPCVRIGKSRGDCWRLWRSRRRQATVSDRDEIERWRQKRLESLKADDGWLTVSGLFWLKPGETRDRQKDGPSNDVVLPASNAWLARDDSLSWTERQLMRSPRTGREAHPQRFAVRRWRDSYRTPAAHADVLEVAM